MYGDRGPAYYWEPDSKKDGISRIEGPLGLGDSLLH